MPYHDPYEGEQFKVLFTEDKIPESLINPTVMVAVHINEDKKIENVELISDFTTDKKISLDDCDEYTLKGAGLLGHKEIEPNTLYHVYLNIHWYQCGGEEPEWDVEVTILAAIPLIKNYSQHFTEEQYLEEQEELAEKDFEEVYGIGVCLSDTNRVNLNLTTPDLQKIAEIIAKEDLPLAHRMFAKESWRYRNNDITGPNDMQKMLNDYYNEEIANIEKLRCDFRKFLHKTAIEQRKYGWYHSDFSCEGYRIQIQNKKIVISHAIINNLDEDFLLRYKDKWFQLIEAIYDAQQVEDQLNVVNSRFGQLTDGGLI